MKEAIDHAKVMEAIETMRHVGSLYSTMSDAYTNERIGIIEDRLNKAAKFVAGFEQRLKALEDEVLKPAATKGD